MRISPIRTLCLLFGLFSAFQTTAHETIPAKWCSAPGESPVLVSKYEFAEDELLNLQKAMGLHRHKGQADDADKCGIVDDWHLVVKIANGYCAVQNPKRNSPLAVITGPKSILEEEHHVSYVLSEGVQGACFVCSTGGK